RRPLELPQQFVPTNNRGVERGLGGFLTCKRLFQLILYGVADQHEGAKPQPARIFGRRLVTDLFDRERGAWIAVIEALGSCKFIGSLGRGQITGVFMPGGLNWRLRKIGKEPRRRLVFLFGPPAQPPERGTADD